MMKKISALWALVLPFGAYAADTPAQPDTAPKAEVPQKFFPMTGVHASRLPVQNRHMPRPDTIDATRNLSAAPAPRAVPPVNALPVPPVDALPAPKDPHAQ